MQLFLSKIKARVDAKKQKSAVSPLTVRVPKREEYSDLTPSQLQVALIFWIQHVQRIHFAGELKLIETKREVPRSSTLFRLAPILDEYDTLRVGGRLKHSILDPYEKHPWILPRESPFSKLLVLDAHQRTLHGGTQLTLNSLRQRFWIVNGRRLVKLVIHRCLECWRYNAKPMVQRMGDLPANRVRPARPFLHTGTDYAGPINIRLSPGRGTKSFKGYIVILVCKSTKAVHLEAASDYTAREFLNVYRRFAARRGICATLSSDCGTNSVGADRELRNLFTAASRAEIAHHPAHDGTEWLFNPPSAPHFGGLWEAAVKSTKFHLKRVIGDTTLTFEELTTLLSQIEACLNSRPLCPLNDDPSSLTVLTPAHFLIGEPLTTIPEPSLAERPLNRLNRFQMIRQMYEHFWNQWSKE